MSGRSIAIVGGYRGTKLLAPYNDQGWEIWSCSPRNAEGELPRHDLWFELHPQDVVAGLQEPFRTWLAAQPAVYMQDIDPAYPGSMSYPKEAMLSRFGENFFTSSIAWMLALAIFKEPLRIGVWGVECAGSHEYGAQRWGVLHFLQVALAAGIEVVLPQGSRLRKPTPLYGYDHAHYVAAMSSLRVHEHQHSNHPTLNN